MSEVLELTDEERELIERLRRERRRIGELVGRELGLRASGNLVWKADPEAAKRIGLPGPPCWHMDPDEVAEMEAFERKCSCAGLGPLPVTDGGQ